MTNVGRPTKDIWNNSMFRVPIFVRVFLGSTMCEEDFAEEFAGLPEYVVGKAIAVPMDIGVRVYHWSKHGTVLMPKFTAVLSPRDLVLIGRSVQHAGMQAILDAEALPLVKN